MANPFSKGWKYLMQSFDSKIDQNADPKVQIQQAVAAAKEQHKAVSEHAANIIGNRNQLQMKMDRLIASQDDLQTKARSALQAADKASSAGDAQKAQEFNSAAEAIATQLVAVEQELEQTKQAYASAEQELMEDSTTDRMAEIESGTSDVAAASRLDQIRASMAGELEAGPRDEAAPSDAEKESRD